MKRRTVIAAILTPVIGGGVGVLIAQNFGGSVAASAPGPCAAPTIYIDMADGASLVTGGPNSTASCEGDRCSVAGAEQVEVQVGGRTQCVSVGEGQSLAMTRRGDSVSFKIEDIRR